MNKRARARERFRLIFAMARIKANEAAPFEIRDRWTGYTGQWILIAWRGAKFVVENWNLRLRWQLRALAGEKGGKL